MANITRNFSNISPTMDQSIMASNFNNMLNKVNNMVKQQESVLSVWIAFQVGDKQPVIFNTASTNIKENLIAQLDFEKTCAGEANTFSLVIKYDPYNHGQVPTDKLEALDELLANAMDYNVDEDNFKELFCYLQYGYNSSLDKNIISPKYCCILLRATSDVDWATGLITYTFGGTSAAAPDSNFTASFDEIPEDNKWKALDLVKWILYYYYGDENNIPEGYDKSTKTFGGTHIKYRIDVPQDLIDDSPEIPKEAVANMNPIQYCKSLLQNIVAVSDNEKKFDAGKKPQYVLYETSENNCPTFHIVYVSPADSEKNITIPYIFTWNNKTNNIVSKWNPEVNLYNYIILKCQNNREMIKLKQQRDDLIDSINGATEMLQEYNKGNIDTIKADYAKKIAALANNNFEYYNASIELLGIPCDPPICAQLQIIPKTLEAVSRTAGWYSIKKATDRINSNGTFITTLELFRLRGLNDSDKGYTVNSSAIKKQEQALTQISNES